MIDDKVLLKKGMKVKLAKTKYSDYASMQAKAGDVVKITSITAMGYPTSGYGNDYENLRVSNGKFSWHISRSELEVIK